MASKRVTVLMAILLLLILAYILRPFLEERLFGPTGPYIEPPLSGENAVTGLEAHKDAKGNWIATYDYFYTGNPQPIWLRIRLDSVSSSVSQSGPQEDMKYGFATPPMVQRGQHHVTLELQRSPTVQEALTTNQIVVEMLAANLEQTSQAASAPITPFSNQKVVAGQHIEQVIEWPDMQTWFFERQFASKSPGQLLNESVAQIDAGDQFSVAQAKQTLERLVTKDPKFDAAYIELARVAMKTNWGPEGLHQAENLLQSSLQISPDSVNAKILLGYVYAHQNRYKEAEKLFAAIAPSDPKNLWLWSNWGEVLVMQGKVDQGIQKYRESILRPRSKDTYDKARLDAYWHLITLLEQRKDFNGLEALYKQRAEEFDAGNCYNADYARFVLQQHGDTANAIVIARKAVDGHCENPWAKEVLGLSNYVAWAGASADQKPELLNQAHVFLPIGPRPLYLLATSDKTVATIRKLLESGESIDQPDNDKWGALSYAIQSKDYAAASRLAHLGAKLDTPSGPYQMPVAMLPIVEGDLEGVKLMKKLGVDYSKLQYQGASVSEQVKRSGNRKLIEMLEVSKTEL